MVALVAAVSIAATRPPAAYLLVGKARVPLAISSWCWRSRCGAPISASGKPATVRQGALVHCVLGFRPTGATVALAGRRAAATTGPSEVTWRAVRSGGLTIDVHSRLGWVVYVGRIAFS